MKLCRNGLHDVSLPGGTVTKRHSRGHLYERCRACVNECEARRKCAGGPRKPARPSTDTGEDFLFLFDTGLQPRQIAVKLDMRYPSLLRAVARAGIKLTWDEHGTARIT